MVDRAVRRVCVVGPESTGKTVLCERLAAHFGAPWVAEYGRDYTLAKQLSVEPERWRPEEFVHIAWEQQRLEDEAALRATDLLICDTDAFATEIWLERYLGPVDPGGWPPRAHPMDLYLLTDPHVPFVADAIRDGEHLREWMFERFVEELTRRNLRFTILRGNYAEREQAAIEATHALLAKKREQAPPTSP
jgi:NadR type nicotinamide-nucleotide adenylyltransferase